MSSGLVEGEPTSPTATVSPPVHFLSTGKNRSAVALLSDKRRSPLESVITATWGEPPGPGAATTKSPPAAARFRPAAMCTPPRKLDLNTRKVSILLFASKPSLATAPLMVVPSLYVLRRGG